MNIVSLTTLPSRIAHCGPMIRSLLSQSILPDTIEVNLPRQPRRDNKPFQIPDFFDNPRIKIHYTEDYGPLTKVLPTLQRHLHEHVSVITVDDDIQYPPLFLETLSKAPRGAAAGFRGRKLGTMLSYNLTTLVEGTKVPRKTEVDILTGVYGARYSPRFFKSDFFEPPLDTPMFYTDDIWISGHLAKNGIKRIVVPIEGAFVPTHSEKALWDINQNGNNNNHSLKYFKNHWHV